MDTRIIRTSIFRDHEFRNLSDKDKTILLFLLLNEYLEAFPCIKIDTELIAFHCKTSKEYIEKILPSFSYFDVFYINGFLMLGEKFTYANYQGGKTKNKKNLSYNKLPEWLGEYIGMDGVIAQPLPNHCSMIEHIKHKTETINHKTETINPEKKIIEKKEDDTPLVVDQEVKVILLVESILKGGTRLTSARGFKNNWGKVWRNIHSLEKVNEALAKRREVTGFFHDISLETIFRQKNQKGEDVDYINSMLQLPAITESSETYPLYLKTTEIIKQFNLSKQKNETASF